MICSRRSITLAWLLIFLALCAQSRHVHLDSRGRFNVSWSFSGTKPNDSITFTVEARTTGWVGLGMSKDGSMDGGDFWVAWVDSNGSSHIQDMHRLLNGGNGLPALDFSNDISLINASESNGITRVTFTRKLNTCDRNGDIIIDEDTVRLIYAFGPNDPVNNILAGSNYHLEDRGAKSVYLLQMETITTSIPSDARTFDILIKNYTIPNDSDTTYHCEFFSLPKFSKTQQIVAVEPVITSGNDEIVHHMSFYACPYVTEEAFLKSPIAQQGGLCFNQDLRQWYSSCQSLVFVWAVGGSKLIIPENVGYSIADGSAPVVYMMEMHYNNPLLKPGRKDSSGMRFTYTEKLRTHSMEMLSVGTVHGIFVPPKAERFRVTGFCHGSCTQEWIPPTGITVFGYLLHAHLLGVAIQVDLHRNGTAGRILAIDDRYDFNFQENKLLKEPIQLLPGDTIKVTCMMSSPKRLTPTFGGLGTSNEMCLAMLMYYPKQNVAPCTTGSSYLADPSSLLYSSLTVKPEMAGNYVDIEKTLNSVNWSPVLIAKAQEAVDKSTQASVCKATGNKVFASNRKLFNSTDFPILIKRKIENTCTNPGQN